MITQLSRDNNAPVSAARILNQKASSAKYYPGTRALFADTWSEAQYNVALLVTKLNRNSRPLSGVGGEMKRGLTVDGKTDRIV